MPSSGSHHMYYLAVICPGVIGEKIQQFKLWMKEHHNSSKALRSPAHITLVPPFWLDKSREPELLNDLENYEPSLTSPEVVLNGFSHFSNKVIYVDVVDNPLLSELQQEVLSYFRMKFGTLIKVEDKPFKPHVTIAARDLKPGDFNKAWDHFSNKKYTASFLADKISLLRLTPQQWEVVAEKTLR